MDPQLWIAAGLAIVAGVLWFCNRVTRGRSASAPVQKPDTAANDRARAAIKAAADTVQAEISADLQGKDPAGDLADRANRRRR